MIRASSSRRVAAGLLLGLSLLPVSTHAAPAGAAGGAAPTQARADGSLFREAASGPSVDELPRLVLDAHRGGGLEVRENSMSGIRHAVTGGVVDVVDLDVRQLADGTLGVMHDSTVDRVTTSSGRTASYTRAEWRRLRLDIGKWLDPRPRPEAPPTLERVLKRFGDRTVFTIEVKSGLVDDVARLLRSTHTTDSVFVATNRPRVARLIHRHGLHSHLWRSVGQMRTDDPRTFEGFVDLLDIDVRAPKADFRRAVRSGVRRVWSHTITTRAERDRALRLGAKGVITDDPEYVAGVRRTYPASTTVVDVRGRLRPVQASDQRYARVRVVSESGPALPEARVTVASRQVGGRTVATGRRGVHRVLLSAARAERGKTEVRFRVAGGRAGERRWPGAGTVEPFRVTGEDLRLRPSVRVGRRGLRVSVALWDSAAPNYDRAGAERGTDNATLAGLRNAVLRLRVLRHGEVVHRQRIAGADNGNRGNGIGEVSFRRWDAPRRGRCTVRVVQRGPVYRRVMVEERVRLG